VSAIGFLLTVVGRLYKELHTGVS